MFWVDPINLCPDIAWMCHVIWSGISSPGILSVPAQSNFIAQHPSPRGRKMSGQPRLFVRLVIQNWIQGQEFSLLVHGILLYDINGLLLLRKYQVGQEMFSFQISWCLASSDDRRHDIGKINVFFVVPKSFRPKLEWSNWKDNNNVTC